MVNLQRRHQTEPIGIHYFVARRQVGDEVRFPRPPVVTEPVTEVVTKKHALPRGKLVTGRTVAQAFLVSFLAVCWWGPTTICLLLAKFGPQPSALILPPPPYHEGQKIQGPDTTGQTHLWIYIEKAGWVDP